MTSPWVGGCEPSLFFASACAASASRLIVPSRRSHCAARSAMARVAWSRRPACYLVENLPALLGRLTSPACSSTTRCLETAWREKDTRPASQLALTSPLLTRRSSTRRRDGSAMADHSSSSACAVIPIGASRATRRGGPGTRPSRPGARRHNVLSPRRARRAARGRFRLPGDGSARALGRQRELDQHRVAGHWFLPAGMVPAE